MCPFARQRDRIGHEHAEYVVEKRPLETSPTEREVQMVREKRQSVLQHEVKAMPMAIFQFVICASVIIIAGTFLTRFADAIAEITILGLFSTVPPFLWQ